MTDTANTASPQIPGRRIEVLDLARGLALLAMASYHFSWDIEQFGYLDHGTTTHGLFKVYARSIAGGFLFLAGVSLMLAHSTGIRLQPFLKRLGMVAGAAALITLVTFFATPDTFIYFGILHAIAASSVIGLAFLRLPAVVTVLAGIGCIVLPLVFRADMFNPVWLHWVGLSTVPPRSNDYVPLMPWLGPFLIGMGAAKLSIATKFTERLANVKTGDNRLAGITRYFGRHSLAFYLLHQPVLLTLVWTTSQLAPPRPVDPLPGFVAECEAGCADGNSAEFCSRFCLCVTDELISQGMFDGFMAGEITPESDARIPAVAEQCTAASQMAAPE
ncbi:heparan-alpha-glucosaminide N-acetyltransferase [Hoeflea ulvae]|uniref:DUF1624 domain-containing protein n=1 Tax=Hoeflea ulvae TaxID=2983764 RepID=A0ABT3YFY3_9HYPH|nr:heparan-alpha-glucosaminide N-acetyltransferase [Hoeflea ulvae]MCY0094810.1 DUF1624 domain-containing protein [Hoeflea ulvae]